MTDDDIEKLIGQHARVVDGWAGFDPRLYLDRYHGAPCRFRMYGQCNTDAAAVARSRTRVASIESMTQEELEIGLADAVRGAGTLLEWMRDSLARARDLAQRWHSKLDPSAASPGFAPVIGALRKAVEDDVRRLEVAIADDECLLHQLGAMDAEGYRAHLIREAERETDALTDDRNPAVIEANNWLDSLRAELAYLDESCTAEPSQEIPG